MDLTVVVVSYNTAALLERCLGSLRAQALPGREIVVVDNASSDASAALVREQFPEVRLIANTRNVGFGAACNQGIAASDGGLVVLVNPDCEMAPGSLQGFADFMAAHPRCAVAGGRLVYGDGSYQESSFRFPTLAQIFLDFFPLNWRLTRSRLNGRYPAAWDTLAFQIDHPLGALLCVRRAAIAQVGVFDPAFFMYAEEVDWCLRFKRAGWEVWHCPAALAVHHGGQSTRQQALPMFVQLQRSRLLLYCKHYSPAFRMAARLLMAAGMARLVIEDVLAQVRAGRLVPERQRHALACLGVPFL